MTYSKFDIDKVRQAADIRNHIPDTVTVKRKVYATCPNCGKTGIHGMLVTHNSKMDLAKCFSCQYSLNGSINAVMHYENLTFPEAVKKLADYYGIPIRTEEEILRDNISRQEDKVKGSFCEEMLAASGLTIEDVMAKVSTGSSGESVLVPAFRKGGLNIKGEPNFNDDEMLIFYYDLYGAPMKYSTRGVAGALRPYIRIRYSIPENHTDGSGRPVKYRSPKGSGVRFYIPQIIRDAFKESLPIDTLVIQEGEKKAEKACKHGVMSLGIQGIYNIGNEQEGLIQDLQYIVKKCQVKNVVLLFDSDWDHLHRDINPGDDLDQRPNQFAKAAIKFKTYVETLHSRGDFVDVWFGHINENKFGEKGIDDLLAGSLKGKEDLFLSDMQLTMKSHNGIGIYADFHKISSITDYQIMEFWHLRDREKFFKRHKVQIENLSYFRFGKVYYKRNEAGDLVKSSAIGSDSNFWSVTFDEDSGKKECGFNTRVALSFLEANGFFKYRTASLGPLDFGFIAIDNNIIRQVGAFEIRDFIYNFAEQNCRDEDILNMLAEKLGSLLSSERLERLREKSGLELEYEPEVQNRYYLNGQVRITPYDVEFGSILRDVWRENVIQRKFKRIQIIESIEFDQEEGFLVTPTADGEKCEFLQYLVNASNFWKNRDHSVTQQEQQEFQKHIVNKITSIGYLLTDYKYASERKSVVAMDAKMSEVGMSNGRSGKSMIGYALEQMMEQTTIDGKKVSPNDTYIFSEVTERTRNIFYDDARVNFDFESFFQSITGRLAINPKSMARFSIAWDRAPKFYITTNHAINSDSGSAKDRIIFMSFSDWYNSEHTPIMEFGHNFFYDWDDYQWNLFDNLMAECVMYYFRSMVCGWSKQGCGAVDPPMSDLNARRLRQKIGEAYLQWADSYFDPTAGHLNNRVVRKDMFNSFLEEFPGHSKFVSPSAFKDKLKAYCEFRGLHLNPHKPNKEGMSFSAWMSSKKQGIFIGDREVASSNEYLTVATHEFAINSIF